MNFKKLLIELCTLFLNHIKIYKIEKGSIKLIENLENLPELSVNLTDDTRKIEQNSIFFLTYFSRKYLDTAIQQNPLAMFINKNDLNYLLLSKYNGYCIIGKKNPDFYLGHISNIFYNYPSKDMYIVAVTGTNGKTTTAFMIYYLWKKKNIPCGFIGTLGIFYWNGEQEFHKTTGFTTPRSYELHQILEELKSMEIFYVVMEASSEALALRRLDGMYIQKAIFTSFGRDHLNFHKTINSYFFSKLHLFFLTLRTTHQKNPFIVVYDKNTYYNFYKFSKKTKCNILFLLKSNLNHNFVKNQPNPYLFNQWNALCAFYALQNGKNNLYKLSESPLKDFPGVSGRMEKICLNDNFDIIIDYAHTPDALETVLKELKNIYKIIIIVFGCGGNRDKEKRPIMGQIASMYCDYIFLTDDNPREEKSDSIRKDIKMGISSMYLNKVLEIPDRKKAIEHAFYFILNLVNNSKEKTCLLIAGKGHEDYQIIGKEKIHFSDKEVVLEILNKHKFSIIKNK